MVAYIMISKQTVQVTGITGGGVDASGWQEITTGTPLRDSTVGDTLQMWWGRVGTANTGTTITVTFNVAPASLPCYNISSYRSTLGTSAAWAVNTFARQVDASSTSMPYPSITPTVTGCLGLAHAAPQNSGSNPASSGGWTFRTVDPY